ncbi:MAG: class I SAM-dependent methyltransferase [Actinomycetota bacterium]
MENLKQANLGCGNVPLLGFTNIDKYYYPGSPVPLTYKPLADTWNQDHPESPWVYGDIVHLDFPDNTFDRVILVHVLEHVSMEHGNLAIKEAHRVCKLGGIVEIEVPDLTRACEMFPKVHITDSDFHPWYRVMGLLYGTTGCDGEGQFHLCGYSKEYLRFKLNERGFINIEEIPVGFGHGNSGPIGHAEPQFDFRMKAIK